MHNVGVGKHNVVATLIESFLVATIHNVVTILHYSNDQKAINIEKPIIATITDFS